MTIFPICVDASVVVRLLVAQVGSSEVEQQWMKWRAQGRRIIAPRLMMFEVTNALHRYVRHGVLTLEEAGQALDVADQLGIRLADAPSLHIQALALAQRWNHGAAYDAHYLALAEALGAELWTADSRLARSVRGEFEGLVLIEPPASG